MVSSTLSFDNTHHHPWQDQQQHSHLSSSWTSSHPPSSPPPPPPSPSPSQSSLSTELVHTNLSIMEMRQRLSVIDNIVTATSPPMRPHIQPHPYQSIPLSIPPKYYINGYPMVPYDHFAHLVPHGIVGVIPAAHGGYYVAVEEDLDPATDLKDDKNKHTSDSSSVPVTPSSSLSPSSSSPKQRLLARAREASSPAPAMTASTNDDGSSDAGKGSIQHEQEWERQRMVTPPTSVQSILAGTWKADPTTSEKLVVPSLLPRPQPSSTTSTHSSRTQPPSIPSREMSLSFPMDDNRNFVFDHHDRLSQTVRPNSSLKMEPLKPLPEDFVLSSSTVVLGKGSAPKEARGNQRLQRLVHEYLDVYATSERHGKIGLISKIVRAMSSTLLLSPSVPSNPTPSSTVTSCQHQQEQQHQESHQGSTFSGFVRYYNGRWYEASDKDARIKVTSMFRDALHSQYKSSSKSKVSYRRNMRRRQQLKQKREEVEAPK